MRKQNISFIFKQLKLTEMSKKQTMQSFLKGAYVDADVKEEEEQAASELNLSSLTIASENEEEDEEEEEEEELVDITVPVPSAAIAQEVETNETANNISTSSIGSIESRILSPPGTAPPDIEEVELQTPQLVFYIN